MTGLFTLTAARAAMIFTIRKQRSTWTRFMEPLKNSVKNAVDIKMWLDSLCWQAALSAKRQCWGWGEITMFNQIVTTALSWKIEEGRKNRNPPRRIGESGERRIIRMARAGYNVWEAWQILGTYDYSTIARVYKKHGIDTRGDWA